MTGPIMNPSIFYWINTLESIKLISTILAVLSFMAFTILLIVAIYNYYSSMDIDYREQRRDSYKTMYKKMLKLAIISGALVVIFVLISVFIPGKSTSIEMMIAKTATYENTEWTLDRLKEAVDYIVSAIKGI